MAEWECDICGLTPCPNRSFCKACRKLDRRRPPGREAREPRPDFPVLAQSTKGCHRLAAAVSSGPAAALVSKSSGAGA